MERTGIMRAKENHVEQQENENVGMWDHASMLRQARDARRKRILARSSERLAFITGEANAISTSPLLDKSNSLSSILNQDVFCHYNCPDRVSTMKKSLFNEYEDGKQSEAQKKIVNNRENTSKAGAAISQPSKSTDTMEACKEQAHESINENPITFKRKVSYCIKQSLFPRLICAACIGLAFLASVFTQGGHLDGPNTLSMISSTASVFAQSGHLGRPDILFMICYSLAVVMLVDLLLFMGFFPGTEHLKLMRNRKAMANKPTLSILFHVLLSVSLDCSVSASLLCGGWLVLSKYFPNHIYANV